MLGLVENDYQMFPKNICIVFVGNHFKKQKPTVFDKIKLKGKTCKQVSGRKM